MDKVEKGPAPREVAVRVVNLRGEIPLDAVFTLMSDGSVNKRYVDAYAPSDFGGDTQVGDTEQMRLAELPQDIRSYFTYIRLRDRLPPEPKNLPPS